MSEAELWDSTLLKFIKSKINESPELSIADAYSDAYKFFLNEKWICYLEPNKYNFTQEEYEKMGFDDGPDLTRIPRTRYNYFSKKGALTSSGGTTKKTAYQNFVSEQRKKYGGDFKEIAQKWNKLTDEEKEQYKPK